MDGIGDVIFVFFLQQNLGHQTSERLFVQCCHNTRPLVAKFEVTPWHDGKPNRNPMKKIDANVGLGAKRDTTTIGNNQKNTTPYNFQISNAMFLRTPCALETHELSLRDGHCKCWH